MNNSKKKISIAVIGLGRIGKLHLENLTHKINNVEITWAIDPRYKNPSIQKWLKPLEVPNQSKDIEGALQDKTLDAVFICSSTDVHAITIKKFAQAKKQIFCEKPIDLNLKEVVNTLNVVKKEGVKLQVGFNRRFDRHFIALKNRLSNMGDLRLLRLSSRDPGPPPMEYVKRSGGIFLDMTIHDFDMIRFISESPITEVSVMGDVLIDKRFKTARDIDSTIINMRLANKAMATIDNFREVPYGYDQRIEAVSKKGTLIAGNALPSTLTTMDKLGTSTENPLYFFLERYEESYLLEAQAFAAYVRGEIKAPVSSEEALEPVLVAIAAKKSLKEKRTVTIKEIRKENGL